MEINNNMNNTMLMQQAKGVLNSGVSVETKFSSLLNSNISPDQKQQEIEKAANALTETFPRMLISQMFDSIDNDSEEGGFAQGMFRYLMVEELSKEWVNGDMMKEVKNSIVGQLNKYEKAAELGASYRQMSA